jgi:hypothetical protein
MLQSLRFRFDWTQITTRKHIDYMRGTSSYNYSRNTIQCPSNPGIYIHTRKHTIDSSRVTAGPTFLFLDLLFFPSCQTPLTLNPHSGKRNSFCSSIVSVQYMVHYLYICSIRLSDLSCQAALATNPCTMLSETISTPSQHFLTSFRNLRLDLHWFWRGKRKTPFARWPRRFAKKSFSHCGVHHDPSRFPRAHAFGLGHHDATLA